MLAIRLVQYSDIITSTQYYTAIISNNVHSDHITLQDHPPFMHFGLHSKIHQECSLFLLDTTGDEPH